jgi:tRNA (guanine37-N1)-methyltransferase
MVMQIDVISLFPKMFESPFAESIIGRAVKKKKAKLRFHSLRDWALDSYGTVDDKPFGGGEGMVLRIEPIDQAITDIKKKYWKKMKSGRVIALSAKGRKYKQEMAENLAKFDGLILICGHYEGFDQRILDHLVDEVISIGDFVMTGGEIGAMVVIDSVVRLIPGVLGKDASSFNDSFSKSIDRLRQFGRYTRPSEYKGWHVPEVLLSGNPKKIKEWQKQELDKSGGNKN